MDENEQKLWKLSDPKELLQKYGGDALGLYLMGSPVMHGEDIIISEEQYRNQVKGLMLILWNTYNFLSHMQMSTVGINKKKCRTEKCFG